MDLVGEESGTIASDTRDSALWNSNQSTQGKTGEKEEDKRWEPRANQTMNTTESERKRKRQEREKQGEKPGGIESNMKN